MARCEWCGEPLRIVGPFQGRPPTRFCCAACCAEWHAEFRRQAVAAFRAAGLKVERPWQMEAAE
jgi:hypothetical protein